MIDVGAAAPGLVAPNLADLDAALAPHGLMVRGGFHPDAGDDPLDAGTILLVGHAGARHWPAFQHWLAAQRPAPADPLDRWSKSVVTEIAGRFEARALFPSDRPYAPFQQWAMRAEGLKPSPLGLLMHPRYGLWHAYRGALLLGRRLDLPEVAVTAHPCWSCTTKPCLGACPVDAYDGVGFAYRRCLDHIGSDAGQPCRSGCLDRNACPVGTAYRYPAHVQAFHQAAFAGL